MDNKDEPVDMEISLRRYQGSQYSLDLRVMLPDSQGETQPLGNHTAIAEFDFDRLDPLKNDPDAYGQALGEMFFADDIFATAIASAHIAAPNVSLRLRLQIGPEDRELHSLRWETLRNTRDPNNMLLTTSERVLFSRYLASADWRSVRPRPRTQLRALVAVASPTDLSDYNLIQIAVEDEIQLARSALNDIPVTVLGDTAPLTVEALIDGLREEYDIVYLLAHAVFEKNETFVYLANAQNKVTPVAGSDLAAKIDGLVHRPRLFILAACQSAGDDTGAALTALGPRLAVTGIPAVIAMQGSIAIDTVKIMLPAFFTALQKDPKGRIDYAMAVARALVHQRKDFWMPVLFMRLKSGCLWYTPDFAPDDRGPAESKWLALIDSIKDKQCTPIIGPDLIQGLVGSRRDMARVLAEKFYFPLAPHDRDGLPQVSQFLAVNQSLAFLQRRMMYYLCEAIRRQGSLVLSKEIDLEHASIAQMIDQASVTELYEIFKKLLPGVWEAVQARNPFEPHRVLARLPFRIYVTTDPSDLLIKALEVEHKKPRVTFAPWNDHTRRAAIQFNKDKEYDPSIKEPLVYRLFGSLQEPDSLVLTENDHFDYLINVTRNKEQIPKSVRPSLTDAALLFLGFRPDDWAFRVFFRDLLGQPGAERLAKYAHIAVQVAPDEERFRFPKQAQSYMERYLSKDAHINVYWGSADDFVRQLDEHWSAG